MMLAVRAQLLCRLARRSCPAGRGGERVHLRNHDQHSHRNVSLRIARPSLPLTARARRSLPFFKPWRSHTSPPGRDRCRPLHAIVESDPAPDVMWRRVITHALIDFMTDTTLCRRRCVDRVRWSRVLRGAPRVSGMGAPRTRRPLHPAQEDVMRLARRQLHVVQRGGSGIACVHAQGSYLGRRTGLFKGNLNTDSSRGPSRRNQFGQPSSQPCPSTNRRDPESGFSTSSCSFEPQSCSSSSKSRRDMCVPPIRNRAREQGTRSLRVRWRGP